MITWRRLLGIPQRVPGNLLTAIVGLDKKPAGGWLVTWVGDGVCPAEVRAATMTEAVDQAAAAVAELYARYPKNPAAELQFAIYPWNYRRGPLYDIATGPDGFSAHDVQDLGPPIHGHTLEDLVAAAEQSPSTGADQCVFRWIRPAAT